MSAPQMVGPLSSSEDQVFVETLQSYTLAIQLYDAEDGSRRKALRLLVDSYKKDLLRLWILHKAA